MHTQTKIRKCIREFPSRKRWCIHQFLGRIRYCLMHPLTIEHLHQRFLHLHPAPSLLSGWLALSTTSLPLRLVNPWQKKIYYNRRDTLAGWDLGLGRLKLTFRERRLRFSYYGKPDERGNRDEGGQVRVAVSSPGMNSRVSPVKVSSRVVLPLKVHTKGVIIGRIPLAGP
jgi:hypothetical protein